MPASPEEGSASQCGVAVTRDPIALISGDRDAGEELIHGRGIDDVATRSDVQMATSLLYPP